MKGPDRGLHRQRLIVHAPGAHPLSGFCVDGVFLFILILMLLLKITLLLSPLDLVIVARWS